MGTFPAVVKSLMEVFFMYCLSGVHLTFRMIIMGDLAVDRPAWWRWAYLGLWQSSGQLQMISPT